MLPDELFSFIYEYWFPILITLIILLLILKKSKESYHSHWNTLVANFKYSSQEFYKSLSHNFTDKRIDGLDIELIHLREDGLDIVQRAYLKVSWKNYVCYLCCAPFGDGMFFSWWQMYNTSPLERRLHRVPFIGKWLHNLFFRMTFFKVDSASIFMTYCHQTMLETIEAVTEGSGIRISDEQRKPILQDVFKR